METEPVKVDRARSTSPLRCCQRASGSSFSDVENEIITEKSIPITANNNYQFHLRTQEVEKRCFPKRAPINLQFKDISYTTYQWSLAHLRERKEILHGVSGEFRSGDLSVIMGPSGAGKSTLLNILAGYKYKGSDGLVAVNGKLRDPYKMEKFQKLSAYIQQEDQVRPSLTALESMTFAANLKLGCSVSEQCKKEQVDHYLDMLGLESCSNTLTCKLSGGQRKRLAIALELLSNPHILFLDEPTTGLDSSSCTQCISLLKRLSQEGRTVICTVHQPSALLFEMFDHLYAIAEGRCIYQGSVKGLVPYLDNFGLCCPPYHNPADFLTEISMGDYGADVLTLSEVASSHLTFESDFCSPVTNNEKGLNVIVLKSFTEKVPFQLEEKEDIIKPASSIMQLYILLMRNLLISKRNYKPLLIRLIAHVFIGLLFGYLYRECGYYSNMILANYVYIYGSLLLIVYTGKMSVTLSFPLEMQILKREHFNRWYKLVPYVLSVILVEIPFQILCAWSYLAISYWLTKQSLEFDRLSYFVLFCTLSTLCAQSWGYFIGATSPIKIAVFLGPVVAVLFSVFGFCIRYKDTPFYFAWLYDISYYRAAFQSVVTAVYGMNRGRMACPENQYCHFRDPYMFLKEMDITDVDMNANAGLIIGIGCMMHLLTFFTLWYKLNKR